MAAGKAQVTKFNQVHQVQGHNTLVLPHISALWNSSLGTQKHKVLQEAFLLMLFNKIEGWSGYSQGETLPQEITIVGALLALKLKGVSQGKRGFWWFPGNEPDWDLLGRVAGTPNFPGPLQGWIILNPKEILHHHHGAGAPEVGHKGSYSFVNSSWKWLGYSRGSKIPLATCGWATISLLKCTHGLVRAPREVGRFGLNIMSMITSEVFNAGTLEYW